MSTVKVSIVTPSDVTGIVLDWDDMLLRGNAMREGILPSSSLCRFANRHRSLLRFVVSNTRDCRRGIIGRSVRLAEKSRRSMMEEGSEGSREERSEVGRGEDDEEESEDFRRGEDDALASGG